MMPPVLRKACKTALPKVPVPPVIRSLLSLNIHISPKRSTNYANGVTPAA